MNEDLKQISAQAVADILRDACECRVGESRPDGEALKLLAEDVAVALAAGFAKFS